MSIWSGPLLVMPVAILWVGGASIYACGGLWFLLVPGFEPHYLTQWLPGLMLSGIGVGMTLPSLAAAAVNRLPADQYAVGSAVNQATRQIGSVLGVAVTVLLLGHEGLKRGDFSPLHGTHVTLGLLTALLCLPVAKRAPKLAT